MFRWNLTHVHLTTSQDWINALFRVFSFRFGTTDLLCQYWFLPVMFFSYIIAIIAKMIITNQKYLIVFACCIYLVGYSLQNKFGMTTYDFYRVLYYGGYYIIGNLFGNSIIDFAKSKVWYCYVMSLFLFICISVAAILYADIVFHNAIYYFIISFAGIVAILCLSILIERCYKLQYIVSFIGKNTMAVFTWHILVFKITELVMARFNLMSMSIGFWGEYHENNWWWLFAISGISVPLGVSIWKKHISFQYTK